MSLPKIDLPIYELKLPSNGKTVRVRPFVVKEEKLLLIAAESDDTEEIINTTKQVINNCLIDSDIDIDTLPFFDIDYLFIALRAKSIGETLDMMFTCNAIYEGEKCGNVFDAPIDISNARVIMKDDLKNVVELGDTSVKMRYPTYSIMKTISDNDSVIDKKIKIIAHCIEMVTKGDKIYSRKDYTMQELIDFVEGLTEIQYKKLEYFIDNFPYFIVDVEHECTKCGFNHRLEYRDFAAFFQ